MAILLSGCKKSDEAPIIKINAGDTLYADFGVPFPMPSLIAFDREDHDLSDFVTISDNLDVNRLGTYEVVFSVTDSDGNSGTDSRVVIILPRPTTLAGNYRSYNNCLGCGQSGQVSIAVSPNGMLNKDRIRISPSLYGQTLNNTLNLERNGNDYFVFGGNNGIVCANSNSSYDVYYGIAKINPTCDSILIDLKLDYTSNGNPSFCTALYVRE